LLAALGGIVVAGGGAWIAWPRHAAPVDAPVVAPALPTGPLVARPIAELGGCSSDPIFVDDGTLVFAQVGGSKDGIYALARGAAPRWVWDGPRREFALAPSGLPHKVLFYTDHIEQLDVATGAHADVVQRFNFFLNPFVIGIAPPSGTSLATPDAFYYLAQAGRSLYRSDGATARAIASLPAGEIANFDALAADGRALTISAARGLYAIDLAAPSPALVKLATRRVAYHRAPIAPGGQWIYYPNVDGISVFDRATGREALLVPGASAAGGLALSPDGRALVGSSCQAFGTATDTTDPRAPALFEEALDWPVLASDGSWLYALNLPSGPIAARRLRDGRVVRLSPPELGAALTPTLSPDGLQAAFAIDGVAPGIYVAPADGSGAPRLVAPDGGHYPMWLPDGRLAFARPDAAGSIRLYALPPEGGAPVLIHPRSRRLADVLRATGEVLLVDGTFTHLWMWDPSTGDERAIVLGPALGKEALAVVRASPDGTRALVTTGLLNSVWRVDLRGGSPPVKLRTGELNEFAGAVYTRDGHEVIIRNAPRGGLWQVDLAGR
ncbi:MAG: hypothetical protein K8W52_35765, partial [Deltaproteobacteria bacterium]|nr:hypothetical protein [Deltaproteobacteria bacterium]